MAENPVKMVTPLMTTEVSQNGQGEPEAAFTANLNTQHKLDPIVQTIKAKFERSASARRNDEDRWLKCYMNYRGAYGKEVQFTAAEKSRVFVKITKTKVLAAYGQLIDVLLAANKFPITIDPTPIPEGVAEAFYINLQSLQGGGGEPTKPVEPDKLGLYKDQFADIPTNEGEGRVPSEVTFHPAYKAAKKMEKKIHDQIEESNGVTHLRHTAFEMALMGTGILKGPLAMDKEYPRWLEDGTYNPVIKTVPKFESVSIWNSYPDPEGHNINDLDFFIERHIMTRSQLRALKRRPHFDKDKIEEVCLDEPGYVKLWWEDSLNDSNIQDNNTRYEVLEYWGMIEADDLKDLKIVKIPDNLKDETEFQINAWVVKDRIIRCVFNPFNPKRIPYSACPYELNPYNFFGVGVAENMEDSQTLMNGFARLAVDNAVLAGNLIIEVDETQLVPGQDLRIEPGKVFRRNGGAPGQSIFATKWNSTAQDNMLMFDKFRQLADEAVGIPSYSHGQTGISGTNRTAAGMSMLMGASSLNIKTVVKNVDDYLLRPIGEALFSFNMQFDFDPEIKGDLEVKARGTASLMKKEVQSQRAMQFVQIGSNPMIAPFIKMPYLLKTVAESMDMDPDKVINSPEEAQLQAMMLGMMQQQAAMAQASQEEAAVGQDPTGGGGGNIGVGGAPQPGMKGFSGAMPQDQPAPQPMPTGPSV